MNAYVAGRFHDFETVRAAHKICQEVGLEITLDWTLTEDEETTVSPERARKCAEAEVQAVKEADLLVLIYNDGKGLGKFIETGIAIADNKPVVAVGGFRESVFWHLPNVTRVENLDSLRKYLKGVVPLKAAA